MGKLSKKFITVFFILCFIVSGYHNTYALNLQSYNDNDSFSNIPSYNVSDFQREIDNQRNIYNQSINVYQNYDTINISRNLFGFDLTSPVSIEANQQLQQEMAAMPAEVIADTTALGGREFFATESIQTPQTEQEIALQGNQLFMESIGGDQIEGISQEQIANQEEVLPEWFQSGRSIFEPTSPEQVGGRDVAEVKRDLYTNTVLADTATPEILQSVGAMQEGIQGQGKIADTIAKPQETSGEMIQPTEQDIENTFSEVAVMDAVGVLEANPAVMPAESWEGVKESSKVSSLQASGAKVKDEDTKTSQSQATYFVFNGLNNPEKEGVAPDTTVRFKEAMVEAGVASNNVKLIPIYEGGDSQNGGLLGDFGIWLNDEFKDKDQIANEIYTKYSVEVGNLPVEQRSQQHIAVTYSGGFNPLLEAVEDHDMPIDTIVNFGGPSLKGVRSEYKIESTHLNAIVNIYGENDQYGKLVSQKKFSDIDVFNIKLLDCDHYDFSTKNSDGSFTQAAQFNVITAKLASNPLVLDQLFDSPGITAKYDSNDNLVEYEVDLNKFFNSGGLEWLR